MALVNLPWYDLAEIHWATDCWWAEIARQFRRAGIENVPHKLNRAVDYEDAWRSGGFLFGQACGYDVQIAHADRLRVVATPAFAAEGCVGSRYRSWVVVRDDAPLATWDDLRGSRAAINTRTSHSGMNVWRAIAAGRHKNGRLFSEVLISGSHEASLQMIRENRVDVAAVDCVTWSLLARHRPGALAGLRVIGETESAAAPPYVTGASVTDEVVDRMRTALAQAMVEPALAEARAALLLDDVETLPEDAYRPMQELVTMARQHGYREMCDMESARQSEAAFDGDGDAVRLSSP